MSAPARRRALVLAAALLVASCQRAAPGVDASLASARDQIHHGDLATAHTTAEQAAAALSAASPASDRQRVRLLRAEIALLQRRLDDAASLLRERVPADPGTGALRARERGLDGQLELLRGQLAPAIDILADAERLAREAGDRDVDFSARALRGQAEMRLRRWAAAEDTLRRLAADARAAPSAYHEALAVINLGMGFLVRDRFDEALPYFERAAALSTVTLRIRAAALTNAGLCYTRLGDFDRAIGMQRRAVEAHAHGAPVFREQALGELGTTHLVAGDPRAGLPYLEQALAVAVEAGLREDAERWASNLAAAHIRLRDWDAAARLNRISRDLRATAGATDALVYNLVNDAEIAAGRGDAARAQAAYREAIAGRSADPFVASEAEAGLARLARSAGRRDEAAARFDAAIARIERTQTTLRKTDYKLSYLARVASVYDEYVDMLIADGQVARALEIADASRARVLAERLGGAPLRRTPARAFRDLARRRGVTLLVYWLGPQRSHAWVVNGRAIRHAELPAAPVIADHVRRYQGFLVDALGDPLAQAQGPGDALREMLVTPFAAELPAGSRVIIVPDGVLGHLNFETLPVRQPTPGYWIDAVETAVAPSLTTLVTTPHVAPPVAATDTLLLVGDPEASDPAFPRLQHAAAEIAGVARAFPAPASRVVAGAAASPAGFRAADPGRYRLIHFTAHAVTNAESPLDSAVVLSPGEGGYKLYARDVAATTLGAELVTVSACRSAGDRTFVGEGLVGFAWAFVRAGARRVLAGLWDVDDRSTPELMTRLYAGLARGEPPASALRAAKRDAIARGGSFAKPYYWGAFQLIVAVP